MPSAVAFCLVSSSHGPMIINRLDYNHITTGEFYGVGAQIMENGSYDPRDVEMMKNLLLCRREHFGDGVVAIDGGANIGVHSVEWAKLMKGWGSVLAIEAQERIYYALCGNLALQNCFNARAILGAIAAEAGEISFPEPDYTQQASFGSFELRPRVGGEFIGQPIDYGKPTVSVPTLSLDSLELLRVDLLKLDLEGMEPEALQGALEMIKRCKPILFVETIKSDQKLIADVLKEFSYRVMPHGMNVLAIHSDDPTLKNITIEKEAA